MNPDLPHVALLGDSISAGYGLRADDALPNRLAQAMRRIDRPVVVHGAAISGHTTGDGLARLDVAIPQGVSLCIVALGANDLMQVTSPAVVRRNLEAIVARLEARSVGVLLCGMRAPPWAGGYGEAFDAVFPAVARDLGVPLYPFLLDGVALVPGLNLPDRIHPNAEGIRLIAERLAPFVAASLDGLSSRTDRAASHA